MGEFQADQFDDPAEAFAHLRRMITELDARDAAKSREGTFFQMVGDMFNNAPYPLWIKGRSSSGRMLMIRVNKKYQEELGVLNEDYSNKYDTQIWGEYAVEFEANDILAIVENRPVHSSETWINQKTGKKQEGMIVKWPGKIDGITVVYGMALEIHDAV